MPCCAAKEGTVKKTLCTALAATLASLLALPAASAQEEDYTKDTWPLEATKRPLTLDGGMLEIRGDTFLFNLSDGAVGEPFSLAPDLYYGVDKKLTVGITHEIGICLAGEENGCAEVYNDFAIDALYGVMMKGSFQLAGHGGLGFKSIDPFMMGLNVGVLGRINAGNLAIVFDPRLYVGFTERDSELPYGKEMLSIPLWAQFQVNTQTMAYAVSGFEGPLDGFGDGYQVPLGVGALFAVNNRIDFGGEFRFTNLLGKDGDADGRWLILRAALRL
jgi:hypothetical protein